MAPFEDEARKAIPAEVHMISGSMDSQTSSDVFNVGNFEVCCDAEETIKQTLLQGRHSPLIHLPFLLF